MSIPALSTRVPVRDVLLPGTPVRARGLTWEIVHAEQAGEQLRYRLRCTQGDLRGREIDLLSPFEQVEAIVTALDPKRAGPLQEWLLYHRAFLLEQALGPSALQAVQPGRLDIAPYQIVPVMRVLSLSRPRLLLADDVGLGKTVEAGLIIAELIARRPDRCWRSGSRRCASASGFASRRSATGAPCKRSDASSCWAPTPSTT